MTSSYVSCCIKVRKHNVFLSLNFKHESILLVNNNVIFIIKDLNYLL